MEILQQQSTPNNSLKVGISCCVFFAGLGSLAWRQAWQVPNCANLGAKCQAWHYSKELLPLFRFVSIPFFIFFQYHMYMDLVVIAQWKIKKLTFETKVRRYDSLLFSDTIFSLSEL